MRQDPAETAVALYFDRCGLNKKSAPRGNQEFADARKGHLPAMTPS
jgi:hypothetical protein